MRKRPLYQSKHPFDEHPFEVFYCGSWQTVKLIRIENGVMIMYLTDNQHLIEEKRPFSNLRIKSREATLNDCTCFLRPGVDICVLSLQADSSDESNQEPVWLDAKISSIERKPHESECSCLFYVNFYVNQGPPGLEKLTLGKDTEIVGLNQISILQKLEKGHCENQHYRWDFSEDCSTVPRTKIFLGKFSSDVSWLLVTSVLKQIAFDVRSVEKKIVYQILDDDNSPLISDNSLHAVNFRVENGISVSAVIQFGLFDTPDPSASCNADEGGQSSFFDATSLRRSKRRNVQPERFLGCDNILEPDPNWFLSGACRKWRKEEEEEEEEEEDYDDDDDDDDDNDANEDMLVSLSDLFGMNPSSSVEHIQSKRKDIVVSKDKAKSSEVKSRWKNPILSEHQNKLALVPVPSESDSLAIERYHHPKSPRNYSEEMDNISFKHYKLNGNRMTQRQKIPALDYMDYEFMWKRRFFNNRVQSKSHHSICSRRDRSRREDFDEPLSFRKTPLSAGAYNKLINSYLRNIDSTITKEEPLVIDRWNEFKKGKLSEKRIETEQPSVQAEEEISEIEMLWREMELCMASAYLEEDEARVSTEPLKKSSEGCQHEYILDEEIGIRCRICGFVSTEIKHVSAPFMEHTSWTTTDIKWCEEDPNYKADENEGLDISFNHNSSDSPLSEENDNVWALIPEFRKKLHFHQKKAFEFLWQNIAGSLVPALMESSSENTGGCAVSHSPGAGKTFLIIAFLVSYLKLFPGKRPLVLAPKTTLYTWYKEFIKWESPIPVHLIHGRKTYRVFKQRSLRFHGVPRPNQDVMHILDCLEKIQKWHAQPSVLVMGYTSFLTLMREDSKFAHRKYMAKVLRESPGLLILDEGHNPRSTKSRLRKVLMKVETDLRILLSGTLFQNNFCEYFNTLCLARPKFVNEVLSELDSKFKRKNCGVEKARHLLENRARKFFLDIIARKIDSDIGEERMVGLNMLRNITSGFIDVYEGANSDSLPGLQIYTMMMNSTDIQHDVLVKLRDIMAGYTGYPLELELLITLASIHPWLVRTSNCVGKFFSAEEQMELEKLKYDFKKGSKVMFVLNLTYRVVKREKVLIFCHNIAPINLFVDLFENVFRWQKGREILVLTGDLELFERGRIIDKFEEPGGPSRVLLASITACAEGISLTAASRVILLDSEWNPSKTKQAIARAFRPGQQKVVYVYQLLASGTLEEDKYRRTTWKEWVSSMIFSEAFVEDPSCWQAEKIEDDVLREMVAEDKVKSFHMIMKNEKASTG
ncbi:hypothetical protein SLA2020_504130 [Shorea laevis]